MCDIYTMSRKSLDTRTRILESAWKLLEAGQGQGVRMSDIAKAAGVSRQAVYLHFPTRAELLIATTRYLDEVNNTDERLAQSRAARTGEERLAAYIEAWGKYIPEIYGIAKALLAMKDTDEEAEVAWNNRMQAFREGCEAAVKVLKKDDMLVSGLSVTVATDILWTILSVRSWEHFTMECGWSNKKYIERLKSMAHRMLVKG